MLAAALAELEGVVRDALRVQSSTLTGQLYGGIRPLNRSLDSLSLRIREDLDDLHGKVDSETQLRAEMANATGAALAQLKSAQDKRRAMWSAKLAEERERERELERNISASAAFWDAERGRVHAALVGKLAESVGAMERAVFAAQSAVEGR
eukprot:CAMPEP_0181333054 /NCGR_PEP_ID=MMETSP1101-20121128/25448_1 /TAXON_ID=46948 /ORGANISM="Rhodomonas abbreviata, Strain Caron Lab Isolate" /LENGTH=150 /DNA_ID=CAMNT_0023442791 /DNA_START=30 /DNA_END=478 /DNA_ORIENTATION=+